MLVLSRKLGESIVINDYTRVTVVSIDRGKIRLGIEAPPHVEIMREELLQRRREFAEPEFSVVELTTG